MVTCNGTCWMCGASGVLTKEHAFPDWVRKIFALEGNDITNTRHSAGIKTEEKTWVNQSGTFTVRTVCVACNTGWMSKLEATAKPILEPLIYGHPATLDVDAQRTLALWAFKTACVFQSMNEATATIARADRERLTVSQVIASGTEVIAGMFRESGDQVICTRWYVPGSRVAPKSGGDTAAETEAGAPTNMTVAATTLVIGRIFFQVRSQLAPTEELPAGSATGFVVVHPGQPETLAWPPLPPLTEDRIDDFVWPASCGPRNWDRLPPLLAGAGPGGHLNLADGSTA